MKTNRKKLFEKIILLSKGVHVGEEPKPTFGYSEERMSIIPKEKIEDLYLGYHFEELAKAKLKNSNKVKSSFLKQV